MFKKLWALFRGKMAVSNTVVSNSVTLRQESRAADSRSLTAALENGNIVIHGLDRGDEVEKLFGSREYEWIWTIPADQIPMLLQALDRHDDPLPGLQAQFSGANAAQLGEFLDVHQIKCSRWSRVGD